MMYAPLLFTVATFVGGQPVPPPPPVIIPPAVVIVAEPVQATPTVPIHDGRPQASAGQTVLHATTIADDGFGFPVETGPAEIRRLGGPYDVSDLQGDICVPKPWLCDVSYSHSLKNGQSETEGN